MRKEARERRVWKIANGPSAIRSGSSSTRARFAKKSSTASKNERKESPRVATSGGYAPGRDGRGLDDRGRRLAVDGEPVYDLLEMLDVAHVELHEVAVLA